MSIRAHRPKGSSPTPVIVATPSLPSCATATAMFVELPPRNLPKLVTCSRPTPTCSGYRSTPHRPMVITGGVLGGEGLTDGSYVRTFATSSLLSVVS